ncbi:MAG TPA: hypothetical protein VMT50_11955 [Steroidobacteraceae bacterium]|nr:hypothetical protein [Steroidobacteraceae bacterium]
MNGATDADLHDSIENLTALAELLATELDGRSVAPEDQGRPSVVAIADHLA